MTIDSLLAVVRQADDTGDSAEAIERARDDVRREHLPILAAAYGELGWPQRRALVHLVQDDLDAATKEMMAHFLVHSPDGWAYDDARAIALCHVEGSLDAFERYADDPADVGRRARAHGRTS